MDGQQRIHGRFNDLYREHQARWRHSARRLAGSRALGDEVFAEAMAHISARLGARDEITSAYVDTVLRNVALDLQKAARRRLTGRTKLALEMRAHPPRPDRPDQYTIRTERREQVLAAVNALPVEQREVFVLMHLEGFTVQETAEITRKAAGTVKSHLHRALQALREELGDLRDDREDHQGDRP